MTQFTSYLRRVLCKTLLIFPRINGPSDSVPPGSVDAKRCVSACFCTRFARSYNVAYKDLNSFEGL